MKVLLLVLATAAAIANASCTSDSRPAGESSVSRAPSAPTGDAIVGDWYRHATSAHFSADGTGSYTTGGRARDGRFVAEEVKLALKYSSDGRSAIVTVLAIDHMTYDDAGSSSSIDDPEPSAGLALGDIFEYRIAAPHLVTSVAVHVADPSWYGEFLCSDGVSQADRANCGA